MPFPFVTGMTLESRRRGEVGCSLSLPSNGGSDCPDSQGELSLDHLLRDIIRTAFPDDAFLGSVTPVHGISEKVYDEALDSTLSYMMTNRHSTTVDLSTEKSAPNFPGSLCRGRILQVHQGACSDGLGICRPVSPTLVTITGLNSQENYRIVQQINCRIGSEMPAKTR